MNLVDAYVESVEWREERDFGQGPCELVRVIYESYGRKSATTLLFKGEDRKEKADEVKEGYHFLT